VFTDILKFIYTGDESVLNGENAVDLLQAADKLIMNDFKDTIEYFIEQSIDLENAASLLEVGDRFGAVKLKRACLGKYNNMTFECVNYFFVVFFVCLELVTENSENLRTFGQSIGFFELKYNPSLLRELDFHASRNNLSEPGDVMKLAQGKQQLIQATQA
jgi:hypothetical protein